MITRKGGEGTVGRQGEKEKGGEGQEMKGQCSVVLKTHKEKQEYITKNEGL